MLNDRSITSRTKKRLRIRLHMAVTGAVSVQELGERSMLTASSISRAGLASFSCLVLTNLFTVQQCYFALRKHPSRSREHYVLRNNFRFRAPLTASTLYSIPTVPQ